MKLATINAAHSFVFRRVQQKCQNCQQFVQEKKIDSHMFTVSKSVNNYHNNYYDNIHSFIDVWTCTVTINLIFVNYIKCDSPHSITLW